MKVANMNVEKKSFFDGFQSFMILMICISCLKWSIRGLDYLGVIQLSV